MLTNDDLKKIKQLFKKELIEALTIEVQMERYNLEKGMKEYKQEKVYLPAIWTEYLPNLIGTLRGMQEDIDHTKNNMALNSEKLNMVAGLILQAEKSMKTIAQLSDEIKQLNSPSNQKLIEGEIVECKQ